MNMKYCLILSYDYLSDNFAQYVRITRVVMLVASFYISKMIYNHMETEGF